MLTFQSLTESHRSEKATIKCITTVVLDASDTTNQLQKTEKSGAELAANFPGSWLPPSGKSLGWLRGRLTSHRPAGIERALCTPLQHAMGAKPLAQQ